MGRFRFLATVTLIAWLPAAIRAEAPAVAGTLPEDLVPGLAPLLKQAVERAPSQVEASIHVAMAEADKYVAAAPLWPQLSGTYSYQNNRQAIGQGTYARVSGTFYGASVNQPIFEWGAFKNQAAVGALGKKIEERAFAEAYRLLALTIRRQYMELVGKKMNLRNSRYALQLAKENQATVEAKFGSGAAANGEVFNARLSVEQGTLDTDRAEDDFGYAKRVFMRLIGTGDLPDSAVPDFLPHPEFSAPLADSVLTGFVGSGVESTFQSEVYRMQIRQQELNYQIARVRLLPKVGASASYNYSPQLAINNHTVSEYGVVSDDISVTANWNIFDGFATRGEKLRSQAARRLVEHQEKAYFDATIDAVSDMRRQVGFSARALAIAETQTNLAEGAVKQFSADLKAGFKSQSSIEGAQEVLNGAELQMLGARADFLSRWSEFISTAGIDPALSNLPSRYVH
jgi:outer membrane protein TolC